MLELAAGGATVLSELTYQSLLRHLGFVLGSELSHNRSLLRIRV